MLCRYAEINALATDGGGLRYPMFAFGKLEVQTCTRMHKFERPAGGFFKTPSACTIYFQKGWLVQFLFLKVLVGTFSIFKRADYSRLFSLK